MPELEFTINVATGAFELHVHGIAGPACDDVARLVKELLGEPGSEESTAEYVQRSTVHNRAERRIQSRRT